MGFKPRISNPKTAIYFSLSNYQNFESYMTVKKCFFLFSSRFLICCDSLHSHLSFFTPLQLYEFWPLGNIIFLHTLRGKNSVSMIAIFLPRSKNFPVLLSRHSPLKWLQILGHRPRICTTFFHQSVPTLKNWYIK